MFLWLALRLPFFKLEALGINIETDAAVLVSSRKSVCAATPKCIQEGVSIGMSAATAQALLKCDVVNRDVHKEQKLLNTLCDSLYAFTPYIEEYLPDKNSDSAPQGLFLELSRCTKLFGGTDALLVHIKQVLLSAGLEFYWGLSESNKAAWLLSNNTSAQIETRAGSNSILNVDVSTIDEFPKEASKLEKMGFLSFADIQKHIDKEGVFSLKKRFSDAFIQYLLDVLSVNDAHNAENIQPEDVSQQDMFFADTAKPLVNGSHSNSKLKALTVYEPEESYIDSIIFDYPVSSLDLLREPISELLKNLSDYLLAKQKQCGGIQWRLSDIHQHQEVVSVRCEHIYRDWRWLYELSLLKLEQIGLPFEVDQITLMQPLFVDAELATEALPIFSSPKSPSNNRELQRLLVKIQARLGESNVFKVSYKDDHFPECAHKHVGVEEKPVSALQTDHKSVIRPGWMLNTPVSIGKHQNDLQWHGRVELVRGPERLEGHWWNKPTARDYFIAVREDHARLWVFNDLFREEWFVQGVF